MDELSLCAPLRHELRNIAAAMSASLLVARGEHGDEALQRMGELTTRLTRLTDWLRFDTPHPRPVSARMFADAIATRLGCDERVEVSTDAHVCVDADQFLTAIARLFEERTCTALEVHASEDHVELHLRTPVAIWAEQLPFALASLVCARNGGRLETARREGESFVVLALPRVAS